MSIIQDIRDKYAKVAVVAIALALIGFILTDYFSGRGGGGAGGGTKNLGSVNGTSIKADVFAQKVAQVEDQMRQQGYPAGMVNSQAVEQVWGQEVSRILLDDEFDKLGMKIGKKELGDILYGPNMPADLKQQLTDENGFDPVRAKQKIDQMLKDKKTTQEQKDNFNNYVEQLKQQRLSEKYVALLSNSVNFPRWYVEKQNADNSQLGKIFVVREVYSSIADSSVKIEDKEIAAYINKNKEDYQQEESRNISYVTFNASPTAGDSAAIKTQLLNLKAEYDSTSDAVAFLARNGVTNFFDGYIGTSQMQVAAKDSIQRLARNQVYGPYLDGGSYVMAKLIDTKVLPDSVKCRHILLGTQDRSGNAIMPDSVAKAKVDSIERAIKGGANFDTLETKYTTDQAAHADKGVMTFSSATIQGDGFAKEFGQFILFEGKPGDKKVIKTQFGWHYIEILAFIKPETSYKVGYLAQEILPSPETDSKAQEEANQFAADSRDEKGFDAIFEKSQKPASRVKGIGPNIKPNDAQVQGIGYSRSLVRAIYEAKRGEVLKPVQVDDNYVVAVVTAVFEEGTKSPAVARMEVEPALRNKKKAEMLKQKIGKVTTLEAAAVALGGKQIELVDSVRLNSTSTLGYEPKISGATFNPANKGKVVAEAIEGQSGVYVMRVEDVSATAVTGGDVAEQRKTLYQQTKMYITNPQSPAYPVNGLKKAATIKDKRSNVY
ncbi:MAG: peptidylprolyl isomerase [Bacteroidota bacterium]|nr:peptidylprolyl isomerase [Bacteroidota bacterium]